jgi:hypothetical protein
VVGPLEPTEFFGSDDFNLLDRFTMNMYGENLVNTFYSYMNAKDAKSSDVAMKIASLLVARPESKPRSRLSTYGEKVCFYVCLNIFFSLRGRILGRKMLHFQGCGFSCC